MSHQIENQYRFMLESKERVTIQYQVNFANPDAPEIVFNAEDYSFTSTSNQLNRFIAHSLNHNISQTYGQYEAEDNENKINRTANIKFKIPCVGYFNDDSYDYASNNNVLPEFFIKHFKPTPPDSAFDPTKYKSTLDMESNLYVNCNLHIN